MGIVIYPALFYEENKFQLTDYMEDFGLFCIYLHICCLVFTHVYMHTSFFFLFSKLFEYTYMLNFFLFSENNTDPFWSFLGGSVVKILPAVQETQENQVWSLCQEEPLEEGMAIHSSTLAYRISLTEEPGRLRFTGLQRVRYDLSDWAQTHTYV